MQYANAARKVNFFKVHYYDFDLEEFFTERKPSSVHLDCVTGAYRQTFENIVMMT